MALLSPLVSSPQPSPSLHLSPFDVLHLKSPTTEHNETVMSPKSEKGVTLSEEPDTILPSPSQEDDRPPSQKHHRASIVGRKLMGRPAMTSSTSSTSLARQLSSINLRPESPENNPQEPPSRQGSQHGADPTATLAAVAEWLQHEKSKQLKRSMRHPKWNKRHDPVTVGGDVYTDRSKRDPQDEDNDLALDKLESLLAGYIKPSWNSTSKFAPKSPMMLGRKASVARMLRKQSVPDLSSGTDWHGEEILVPSVEADLDNSKTLAYTGGAGDADPDMSSKAKKKDRKHWITFKQDVLRLTHTLRLKGWRRVTMDEAEGIEVARLSGALTNAVYVVKPPKGQSTKDGLSADNMQKKPPVQLLLRIYGPQVEHLIDREEELSILRRLSKKHIGPRMLGTFHNGRFEEFLHAKTLEADDLRVADTSKQIAKRMRELHDGIELIDKELDRGPDVFTNWDKWVDRCELVVSWLDKQVQATNGSEGKVKPKQKYTRLGLVCGVEWQTFRKTYELYRRKLVEMCGGESGLRKQLVFAHNDTQYGNLMRQTPSGESPMMMPSNQHKQLVVIDFEYAGPNTAGLEFANHFTEWCYNYHNPDTSHVCNDKGYPSKEEQYAFVRSYVMHRPQFNAAASATPKMEARDKTNISDFMLDARAPAGAPFQDYKAEEEAREKKQEDDIQRLLHETRLWRIANSAKWVAWGFVQAKVPELDEPEKKKRNKLVDVLKEKFHPQSDPLDEEEKQLAEDAKHDRPEGREQEEAHAEGSEEEEDEEFDYLAYSQERAMLFWGDCLQMGFIKEDELPEKLRSMLKVVPY